MREQWATSGIDLHLEVRDGRPRRLERALREAVQTGRLAPGARLPSSRALSRDLGVARNSVADVYSQLVAEGWLTARRGSGTHVAERALPPAAAGPTPVPGAAPLRYNLRAGSPDLASFPRGAWLAAMRRALLAAAPDAFGYGDPRGRLELREALAAYLARVRGVRAEPERIVVCSGFTQGLRLLAEVRADAGTRAVVLESYGHRHHVDVAVAAGAAVRTVGVDGGGARTDRLGAAGTVVLTPAHQFPLGVPLVARRRTQVVEWAAQRAGLIVEDDYDGEFRYDRQAVGALQALAPDRVVYAGTASKTLAPALRLCWLVVPAHLVDDVVSAKLLTDRHTASLEQLALAELVRSGAYDRHVRRSRLVYRRRRDRLVAALAREAPRTRVSGVAAGLHAVVQLPQGTDEEALVAQAATRGLALEGLSSYRLGDEIEPPGLVVGYATPAEHAFTAAVARLCATVAAT